MTKTKQKWKPHKLVGKSNLIFALGMLFTLILTSVKFEGYRWMALVFLIFAIIVDCVTVEKTY